MAEYYPVTEPTTEELEILKQGDGIYFLYVLSKLQFLVEQSRAGVIDTNAKEIGDKVSKLVKDHLTPSMELYGDYLKATYDVDVDLGLETPTPEPEPEPTTP